MDDFIKINEVIDKAVSAALSKGELRKVYSEPATDSYGHEALHVTIVLKEDKKQQVSGDDALNVIVGIQRDLRAFGEERFPIVEFVTEEELRSNGDIES